MIDKKNSFFNISTGIQLKTCNEKAVNEISRKYNLQNFTSILNTPKVKFIY